MTTPSSVARRLAAHAAIGILLSLAACDSDNLLAPPTSAHLSPTSTKSAVVTSSYSTFDTRAEFSAKGVVDHLDGFEEFTGELVYDQPTPWSRSGVTYTSGLNIVLSPAVGLGVASNSIATEFGTPLTGQFSPDDAVTLFGADLTIIGDKAPVGLVLTTNLGTYSFDDLDLPLASAGRRFFGIALANAGEYLTGFRFNVGGPGTAVLLDNVASGHLGAPDNDPVASAGGPYTGMEGSAISLAMSASDADGDALTYAWDLGDGTKGDGPTPPAAHTYADNGSYDIVLAVADGRGGVDTVRTTAEISNVAPVVAPFTVPTIPTALIAGGLSIPVSTTFTDAGALDTHTATVDCGTGVAAQSDAPNGTAGGVCTFTTPGIYSIQLTVVDKDGGSSTVAASGPIVVYDASAGWVTGGGWISSPAGGLAAAPTLTGKLTFNLVARYEPGSTVPAATADFKLNVARLDFKSTSLDWLVVDGATARMQGRGTMNGVGGYAFAVVASDDAPADAIRIRIWLASTGAIVYDSRPGDASSPLRVSPLLGGSIQIH